MIEQFYVVIELARVGRIFVATEDFYILTELATTKCSATYDRARRAKVGVHDSVASCCVETEEAMHERQTRPGAHDRPGQARATYQARRVRHTRPGAHDMP